MKVSKGILILIFDIIFVNIAFFGALYFHFNLQYIEQFLQHFLYVSVICTIIKIITYYSFALYKSIWEYASVEELIRVVLAVTLSGLLSLVFILSIYREFAPEVLIVTFAFEIILIGGNRFVYRILRRLNNHKRILYHESSKRILLIGSGSTASLIASEIKTHAGRYGSLIGFIDDDEDKIGNYIGGVKVLGNREDIQKISRKYNINEIILASPTLSQQDTLQILEKCKHTEAKVTIVPGIVEIIDGKVSMEKARPVNMEDLLGRQPVDLSIREIANYLEGKTVMVTGGGGSIGSELCRQIIKIKPAKLIILDIHENSIYNLQNELLHNISKSTELETLVASVRERDTIFSLVEKLKPDVIFHAAAHKHVPLMENCPKEAVKNNVFGTLNIAEAANEFLVSHFVLVSSDKAVNPTSIMGATKRLCEIIIQSLAKVSATKFVAVRFGNVLGSNGSVVPLFERQIREGGPVTVTHKDVVRYFMTITEASQLVVQAGAIAKGGEIFVLDMGKPLKIYNVALDLIKLSGLKPHEDIDIVFTGLRPGEKLFEELLMAEEGLTRTKFNKIHVGIPQYIDYIELKKRLLDLESKIKGCTDEEVGDLLHEFVPAYHPRVNRGLLNELSLESTNKTH